MNESTPTSDAVAFQDTIQIQVELDPANPSHQVLISALSGAHYYDLTAGRQTGCDELIRTLLGQYFRVPPWGNTGTFVTLNPPPKQAVNSGDRITRDFHPPSWGGPR